MEEPKVCSNRDFYQIASSFIDSINTSIQNLSELDNKHFLSDYSAQDACAEHFHTCGLTWWSEKLCGIVDYYLHFRDKVNWGWERLRDIIVKWQI